MPHQVTHHPIEDRLGLIVGLHSRLKKFRKLPCLSQQQGLLMSKGILFDEPLAPLFGELGNLCLQLFDPLLGNDHRKQVGSGK